MRNSISSDSTRVAKSSPRPSTSSHGRPHATPSGDLGFEPSPMCRPHRVNLMMSWDSTVCSRVPQCAGTSCQVSLRVRVVSATTLSRSIPRLVRPAHPKAAGVQHRRDPVDIDRARLVPVLSGEPLLSGLRDTQRGPSPQVRTLDAHPVLFERSSGRSVAGAGGSRCDRRLGPSWARFSLTLRPRRRTSRK